MLRRHGGVVTVVAAMIAAVMAAPTPALANAHHSSHKLDELENDPRHFTAARYLRGHPGIEVVECVVAASARRLDAELWTTNVRHFPMLPGLTRSARWRVTFDSGESLVVEGLTLLGRCPEPRPGRPVRHLVPLRSADMSLSKTHAQLQVTPDGTLVVVDRGSTNGSILIRDGVARVLTAGRGAAVRDGDVVRFGDREMAVAPESRAVVP